MTMPFTQNCNSTPRLTMSSVYESIYHTQNWTHLNIQRVNPPSTAIIDSSRYTIDPQSHILYYRYPENSFEDPQILTLGLRQFNQLVYMDQNYRFYYSDPTGSIYYFDYFPLQDDEIHLFQVSYIKEWIEQQGYQKIELRAF